MTELSRDEPDANDSGGALEQNQLQYVIDDENDEEVGPQQEVHIHVPAPRASSSQEAILTDHSYGRTHAPTSKSLSLNDKGGGNGFPVLEGLESYFGEGNRVPRAPQPMQSIVMPSQNPMRKPVLPQRILKAEPPRHVMVRNSPSNISPLSNSHTQYMSPGMRITNRFIKTQRPQTGGITKVVLSSSGERVYETNRPLATRPTPPIVRTTADHYVLPSRDVGTSVTRQYVSSPAITQRHVIQRAKMPTQQQQPHVQMKSPVRSPSEELLAVMDQEGQLNEQFFKNQDAKQTAAVTGKLATTSGLNLTAPATISTAPMISARSPVRAIRPPPSLGQPMNIPGTNLGAGGERRPKPLAPVRNRPTYPIQMTTPDYTRQAPSLASSTFITTNSANSNHGSGFLVSPPATGPPQSLSIRSRADSHNVSNNRSANFDHDENSTYRDLSAEKLSSPETFSATRQRRSGAGLKQKQYKAEMKASPNKPAGSAKRKPKREAKEVEEEVEGEDYITRCICGMKHNDPSMIACDTCGVWQHCGCMSVDPKDFEDGSEYYCERCKPRRLQLTAEEAKRRQQKFLLAQRKMQKTNRASVGGSGKKRGRRPSEVVPSVHPVEPTIEKGAAAETTNSRGIRIMVDKIPSGDIDLFNRISEENARLLLVAPDVWGFVAMEKFNAGEPIAEYKSAICPLSDRSVNERLVDKFKESVVHKLVKEDASKEFVVFADASRQPSMAAMARKSCQNNAEIRHCVTDDMVLHLFIVAKTDISPSTEITIPMDLEFRPHVKNLQCALDTENTYNMNASHQCPVKAFNDTLPNDVNNAFDTPIIPTKRRRLNTPKSAPAKEFVEPKMVEEKTPRAPPRNRVSSPPKPIKAPKSKPVAEPKIEQTEEMDTDEVIRPSTKRRVVRVSDSSPVGSPMKLEQISQGKAATALLSPPSRRSARQLSRSEETAVTEPSTSEMKPLLVPGKPLTLNDLFTSAKTLGEAFPLESTLPGKKKRNKRSVGSVSSDKLSAPASPEQFVKAEPQAPAKAKSPTKLSQKRSPIKTKSEPEAEIPPPQPPKVPKVVNFNDIKSRYSRQSADNEQSTATTPATPSDTTLSPNSATRTAFLETIVTAIPSRSTSIMSAELPPPFSAMDEMFNNKPKKTTLSLDDLKKQVYGGKSVESKSTAGPSALSESKLKSTKPPGSPEKTPTAMHKLSISERLRVQLIKKKGPSASASPTVVDVDAASSASQTPTPSPSGTGVTTPLILDTSVPPTLTGATPSPVMPSPQGVSTRLSKFGGRARHIAEPKLIELPPPVDKT